MCITADCTRYTVVHAHRFGTRHADPWVRACIGMVRSPKAIFPRSEDTRIQDGFFTHRVAVRYGSNSVFVMVFVRRR